MFSSRGIIFPSRCRISRIPFLCLASSLADMIIGLESAVMVLTSDLDVFSSLETYRNLLSCRAWLVNLDASLYFSALSMLLSTLFPEFRSGSFPLNGESLPELLLRYIGLIVGVTASRLALKTFYFKLGAVVSRTLFWMVGLKVCLIRSNFGALKFCLSVVSGLIYSSNSIESFWRNSYSSLHNSQAWV